jgi:hypothetical protein
MGDILKNSAWNHGRNGKIPFGFHVSLLSFAQDDQERNLFMIRLLIQLNEHEARKLAYWAAQELRDPRDQAHFIIRQELSRQGLLPDASQLNSQAHLITGLSRQVDQSIME